MDMTELLQTYGDKAKDLLSDDRNKQALAIVGAVYLLSKNNKERNSIIAGIAALALLPEGGLSNGDK